MDIFLILLLVIIIGSFPFCMVRVYQKARENTSVNRKSFKRYGSGTAEKPTIIRSRLSRQQAPEGSGDDAGTSHAAVKSTSEDQKEKRAIPKRAMKQAVSRLMSKNSSTGKTNYWKVLKLQLDEAKSEGTNSKNAPEEHLEADTGGM